MNFHKPNFLFNSFIFSLNFICIDIEQKEDHHQRNLIANMSEERIQLQRQTHLKRNMTPKQLQRIQLKRQNDLKRNMPVR